MKLSHAAVNAIYFNELLVASTSIFFKGVAPTDYYKLYSRVPAVVGKIREAREKRIDFMRMLHTDLGVEDTTLEE